VPGVARNDETGRLSPEALIPLEEAIRAGVEWAHSPTSPPN
jgi:hypothetical protein